MIQDAKKVKIYISGIDISQAIRPLIQSFFGNIEYEYAYVDSDEINYGEAQIVSGELSVRCGFSEKTVCCKIAAKVGDDGENISENVQNERKEKVSMPYPAADGVRELMPFMTKRKFALKPEEMRDLLAAVHHALSYTAISEESYAPMRDDHSGTPGAVFYIPGTPFAYGGLTFGASFAIYLNKDLIDVELGKLALMYPDMTPGVRLTLKPGKQTNNPPAENEEDQKENKDEGEEDINE